MSWAAPTIAALPCTDWAGPQERAVSESSPWLCGDNSCCCFQGQLLGDSSAAGMRSEPGSWSSDFPGDALNPFVRIKAGLWWQKWSRDGDGTWGSVWGVFTRQRVRVGGVVTLYTHCSLLSQMTLWLQVWSPLAEGRLSVTLTGFLTAQQGLQDPVQECSWEEIGSLNRHMLYICSVYATLSKLDWWWIVFLQ